MKEQKLAEPEEQEKVKKTKPLLLPLLHKEKKDYERGRERPILAVLGDRGSRVYLEPITMAAQKGSSLVYNCCPRAEPAMSRIAGRAQGYIYTGG
jgi:hypothetical protein